MNWLYQLIEKNVYYIQLNIKLLILHTRYVKTNSDFQATLLIK